MQVNNNNFQYTQINSIQDIINPKIIDKNTLMLFDVDETLLIDKDNKRHDINSKCLGNDQFIKIENNIGETISKIKGLNGDKTVLGLTKRKYDVKNLPNSADSQIQASQIPFSRGRFKQLNGMNVKTGRIATINDKFENCFNNGVIYTGGKDKGEALDNFCKQSKLRPKKIVMVDDKVNNLKSVHDFAQKYNIPVTCYLMTGANQFLKV